MTTRTHHVLYSPAGPDFPLTKYSQLITAITTTSTHVAQAQQTDRQTDRQVAKKPWTQTSPTPHQSHHRSDMCCPDTFHHQSLLDDRPPGKPNKDLPVDLGNAFPISAGIQPAAITLGVQEALPQMVPPNQLTKTQ
eukprot:jgi/Psemu1/60023/gm1.60023_g